MAKKSEVLVSRIIHSLDRLWQKENMNSVSPSMFQDPQLAETMIRMLYFLEKRSTKYFVMASCMICACFDTMAKGKKSKQVLH